LIPRRDRPFGRRMTGTVARSSQRPGQSSPSPSNSAFRPRFKSNTAWRRVGGDGRLRRPLSPCHFVQDLHLKELRPRPPAFTHHPSPSLPTTASIPSWGFAESNDASMLTDPTSLTTPNLTVSFHVDFVRGPYLKELGHIARPHSSIHPSTPPTLIRFSDNHQNVDP